MLFLKSFYLLINLTFTKGRLSKSNLNNENLLFQPENFTHLQILYDLTNLISHKSSCSQFAAVKMCPCYSLYTKAPSLSSGPLHLLFPLPEMFSSQNIYMVCSLIPLMSSFKCNFFRTSSLTTISKFKLTLTLALCPALLLFFITFIIILHDNIF